MELQLRDWIDRDEPDRLWNWARHHSAGALCFWRTRAGARSEHVGRD